VCVCVRVRYCLCTTGKHISNVCNTLDNKAVLCLMSLMSYVITCAQSASAQ
jgi:hypothetical protein